MRVAVLICAGTVLLQGVGASVLGLGRSEGVGKSLRLRQDDSDDGDDGDFGDDSDDGEDDGSTEYYLAEMCMGDFENIDSIANATLPCEIFSFMEVECDLEYDGPDDLLFQQECMCGAGSTFFDMMFACENCLKVHGGTENVDYYDDSALSSVSASFCAATPAIDFADALSTVIEPLPTATGPGTDQFPSQTAISDYFTGSLETKLGQITGSATPGSDYPTATATSSTSVETGSTTKLSTTASSTGSVSAKGSATSSSSASSATASGNAAAGGKVVSGMLKGLAAGAGIMFLM